MPNKCPVCFSNLNFWVDDDPIKTENGTKYIFDNNGNLVLNPEDNRQNVGFTKIKLSHIIQLQDNRRDLEDDAINAGLMQENDRTSFTSLQYYAQKESNSKKYIIELRESTEKLLQAYSISKLEYFNYDEDGNNIGTNQIDWNNLDLQNYKGHIRALHIEDLRHKILSFHYDFRERWMNVIPLYPSRLGIVLSTLYESIITDDIHSHNWLLSALSPSEYIYNVEEDIGLTVTATSLSTYRDAYLTLIGSTSKHTIKYPKAILKVNATPENLISSTTFGYTYLKISIYLNTIDPVASIRYYFSWNHKYQTLDEFIATLQNDKAISVLGMDEVTRNLREDFLTQFPSIISESDWDDKSRKISLEFRIRCGGQWRQVDPWEYWGGTTILNLGKMQVTSSLLNS